MSWTNLKRRCWLRWCKMTGAYQVGEKTRDLAYIDRRDLCQNLNQLESRFTDFHRAVKMRHMEIDAEINRARSRMSELMEDKLRVQRETIMDLRQETVKVKDELSALNDEVDLMQKRLTSLESPPVEKISG